MSSYPTRFFPGKWLSIATSAFILAGSSFAATPDGKSAASFKHGISIGHWMAKMRGGEYGGSWFGRDDIVWIAKQGFDHVRYPVDGRLWLLPDGSLDEKKVGQFLQAVKWARENGMSSVLDMHFLPGGMAAYDANSQDSAIFTDEKARSKAAAFWGQVARRLKDEGAWLRFELINEPMAPRNDQLNTLNLALLGAIRAIDHLRVVYVTSNLSSTFATLEDVVPPNDPHVALLLHYDEPMIFTHQRASWKHLPADMPLVNFPGKVPDLSKVVPPEHWATKVSLTELKIEDVDADFAKAAAWMEKHAPGKEVYLGEFGAYEATPDESRRVFIATVRRAAERHGWGWAVWDYKSSFGVRDANGKSTAALDGLFKG